MSTNKENFLSLHRKPVCLGLVRLLKNAGYEHVQHVKGLGGGDQSPAGEVLELELSITGSWQGALPAQQFFNLTYN